MQVKLIRKDGKVVGWTLIAENEQDRLVMGSIRNMQFFGMNDTAIKYAGVTTWSEDERYAQQMAWVQKGVHSEFNISKLDDKMNMPTVTITGDPNDAHEDAIHKLGE
jgi:hypothetical protein